MWKLATPRDPIDAVRIAEGEPIAERDAIREQNDRRAVEPFIVDGIVLG